MNGTETGIIPKTLYGKDAINEVSKKEGNLTDNMKYVIGLEGYSNKDYLDTKGIKTSGVGQVGKNKNKTFKESFQKRKKIIEDLIPNFKNLDENLKRELIASSYRGGVTGSKETIDLINQNKLKEASIEFLNNDEYRKEKKKKNSHIAKRMEALATALANVKNKD